MALLALLAAVAIMIKIVAIFLVHPLVAAGVIVIGCIGAWASSSEDIPPRPKRCLKQERLERDLGAAGYAAYVERHRRIDLWIFLGVIVGVWPAVVVAVWPITAVMHLLAP